MKNRVKELVAILNEASRAYYHEAKPIMQDKEFDELYDELQHLEEETHYILADSPTQKPGYTPVSNWEKSTHKYPALSLGKTKHVDKIAEWLGEKEGILSWKLDGLTVVATYANHKLVSLVTRGDGEVGEDITSNASAIKGLPLSIPYSGEVIIRGEAMISYQVFNEINNLIENEEDKHKTPRNLASGTIRNYDPGKVKERGLTVTMFELVDIDNEDEVSPRYDLRLEWLEQQGFDVVGYKLVSNQHAVEEAVKSFEEEISSYNYPTDGLVLAYTDTVYGKSLGSTSKFPRNAVAFKWNDEVYMTTLRDVEWSVSRMSLNPVAVFDVVNIDGADVQRASIHNVSTMEQLQLGIGDNISVYLANKIIPQIFKNETKSNTITVPDCCPACGASTRIKESESGTRVLVCSNTMCKGKLLGFLELFVSKSGMNIEGLSSEALKKFIDLGILNTCSDLYMLHVHKEMLIAEDGYGELSIEKYLQAIETSKHTTLDRVIRALGIELIGSTQAKDLAKESKYDWQIFLGKVYNQEISLGEKRNKSLYEWFSNRDNISLFYSLLDAVDLQIPDMQEQTLAGKTFVITGSLTHYSRDELKKKIEAAGGKVSGSVSKKTFALINNDTESSTGKNKKAKELGISIISEAEIIKYL